MRRTGSERQWPGALIAPIADAVAVVRDGYEAIGRRCERDGVDAVAMRPLGVPIVAVRGPVAAEAFYDDRRFRRAGALPRPVLRSLLGEHGVQTLDDEAHRHRKAMFMSIMTDESIDDLEARFASGLDAALGRWITAGEPVVVSTAMAEVLCEAVHGWAGVPLDADAVAQRTRQMVAMYDGPLPVAWRHVRARAARRRAEGWARQTICDVHDGRLSVSPSSPLARVALHEDLTGMPLADDVAAVELLNLLRPTVAIERFVVFALLALHEHRHELVSADVRHDAILRFIQEVRRTTPFFPVVGARARHDTTILGVDVPAGRLVMLDLFGTCHHPPTWPAPNVIELDRPGLVDPGPFSLVPQGGGDHWAGHRCAGEWITIRLLRRAVEMFVDRVDYTVPPQDLRVSLRRAPARPRSGLVIDRLAWRPATTA